MADHGGREKGARRLSAVRIEQMLAPFVGAGGRDGAGAGEVGGQQDPVRRQRMLDADPPRLPRRRLPVHADVAAGVDHRRRQTRPSELVQSALHRPALDETGRVDAAGHRPGIEPAVRGLASPAAQLQHFGDLGRRFLEPDLTPAQPAHRALRLPGAEHVVDPVQLGLRAPAGLFEAQARALAVSRRVPRALHPDAERDHRSHYSLLPVAHWVLP